MELAISLVALAVALLSWTAAVQGNRSANYDRRIAVYLQAEEFFRAWERDGRPDMNQLGKLVSAWNVSHFLFRREVTDYLRQAWLDAVQANLHNDVISGKYEGDRAMALKVDREIKLKYLGSDDNMRRVFARDLRVTDGLLVWPW